MDRVNVVGKVSGLARRGVDCFSGVSVAAVALLHVVPLQAEWDCWSDCYWDDDSPYGPSEVCDVRCEWWDFPDPPPEGDPYQDPADPPVEAYDDPHGQDSNRDGWANCGWLVVDGTTHWRGSQKQHPPCGNFHDTCSGRSQPHQGLDFPANQHDPARSLTYGVVTESGWSDVNGNFVRVFHQGYVTSYIHLQSRSVNVNDIVHPGRIIGTVNCTGNCSGSSHHVHVQLRPPPVNGQPQPPVNPYSKLGGCQ